MRRRFISILTLISVLICTLIMPALNVSAAGEKVKLYGNTLSASTKQVCFVRGKKDDPVTKYLAALYAPEFKTYRCVDYDTEVDCQDIAKKLPQLQKLVIISSDVANPESLSKLKDLTQLGLYGCGGTDDLSFMKNIKGLKKLSLSYLYRTSKRDVYEAVEGMTGLESLSITQMGLKNCDFVYDLRELKELTLMINDISDISGLKKLTKLETLNLYGNKVTNTAPLKDLTNLKSINLNDNNVISLKPFEKMTKLEYLGVSRGTFTDVTPLYKLKNLKELDVYETALGKDFADKFAKSVPKCKVNYKYDFDY